MCCRCKTLRSLIITGNQGDENALALLMDSLTLHQRKYGIGTPIDQVGGNTIARKNELLNPDRSNLTLHLGGLLLEDTPVSLQQKTMRHAMAYACQQSSAPRVTLSRRIASQLNPQDAPPRHATPASQKIATAEPATDTHETLLKVASWICLRVQLVQHMESVYDVLEGLARVFQADPRQLLLLSCTEMDEFDSCFIIFSPCDPVDESIQKACTQHRKVMQKATWPIKTGRGGAGLSFSQKKLLPERTATVPALPYAENIIELLRDLARASSPALRKMGVRTVFIQVNPRGDGGTSKSPSTFHCHIRGGGSGGEGTLSQYIPPLFPMASVLDNIDEAADEEDIEEEVLTTSTPAAPFDVTSPPLRENGHRESMWYHEDDDEDEDAAAGEWKDAIDDDAQFEVGDALVFDPAVKEVTENIDSKIVLAIRKLQQSGVIPMDAGAFWQQAFGGGGDMLSGVKEDSLDEDGLFHNVGIRKKICDAMLQRNLDALNTYVNHVKAHNIVGGLAVRLGEQLLSEISALHRDAGNLESLAQKPEDINIVETFLMTCGRMGYSGKEMIMAVELREYLVRWALQEDPDFHNELDGEESRVELCFVAS